MNPLETLFEKVEKLDLPARIVIETQLNPNQRALVDNLSNHKLFITYDSAGFSWYEGSAGFQTQIANGPGPARSGLVKDEILSKIKSWVSSRANVSA